MHVTPSILRELAKKFLREEEMEGVEFYLEHREMEMVSRYILEAINHQWSDGLLDDEEAVRGLEELDLGPKDREALAVEFECLKQLF